MGSPSHGAIATRGLAAEDELKPAWMEESKRGQQAENWLNRGL
jgi:hypothetical protein